MKANELMIGDWVNFLVDIEGGDTEYDPVNEMYQPMQIESITVWGGDDGEVESAEGVINGIDQVKPVPLTAEILEKNGFVKSEEVSDTPPYDKDEEGNMYYSFKGEHKFWGWMQPNNVYFVPANAMGDLNIEFVHELQHAMRLCGIEKEIEI